LSGLPFDLRRGLVFICLLFFIRRRARNESRLEQEPAEADAVCEFDEPPPAVVVLIFPLLRLLTLSFRFPAAPFQFLRLQAPLFQNRRPNSKNSDDVTDLLFEGLLTVAPFARQAPGDVGVEGEDQFSGRNPLLTPLLTGVKPFGLLFLGHRTPDLV